THREEPLVHQLDHHLKALVAKGQEQGFLTFTQVNDYLPDEAINPEKLDQLLMSLEELGLEIRVEEHQPARLPEKKPRAKSSKAPKPHEAPAEETSKRIDDPVRMYLTQMGAIPLLTREQEISLAKKIEITRKRFRRELLESDYVMKSALDILVRVHKAELPFDRTIKVSMTEGLEKTQITGRMPHNLRTLEELRKQNLAA